MVSVYAVASWSNTKRQEVGQELANNWASIGQELVNNSSRIGQNLVYNWATIGKNLVNNLATIGEELVNFEKIVLQKREICTKNRKIWNFMNFLIFFSNFDPNLGPLGGCPGASKILGAGQIRL